MTKDWTEEDIAAYVDGALNAEEAARVEAVLANDTDARALADSIRESNDLLRAAFAGVADAPMSPALAATVNADRSNVVPLQSRFKAMPSWIPVAAAASFAIVVGITLGTQFGGGTGPQKITLGDVPQGGPLQFALETLPSGTPHEDRIIPMLTFVDASGRYCREFEVVGSLPEELEFGIACRTPKAAWHVEMIVTAPSVEPDNTGFAPASGPDADALDAMLKALGASIPLTPEAESEAIKNAWNG